MKNIILNFVTGMAIGSILFGLAVIGLNNTLAIILSAAGLLWMVPFVYANRKLFRKLFY